MPPCAGALPSEALEVCLPRVIEEGARNEALACPHWLPGVHLGTDLASTPCGQRALPPIWEPPARLRPLDPQLAAEQCVCILLCTEGRLRRQSVEVGAVELVGPWVRHFAPEVE